MAVRSTLFAALLFLAFARPDGPLRLNRQTFGGNVAESGVTPHWVVLFCVDWLGACEELRSTFRTVALQQERRLNGALMAPEVRFAEVDCASDKVLCNEQLVETYPTVVHYREGERRADWSGGGAAREVEARRMVRWVEKALGPNRDLATTKKEAEAAPEPRGSASSPFLSLTFAACALGAFAAASLGELRRLWAALRPAEAPKPAAAAVAAAAAAAPEVPQSRLARCLPAEWAAQRGSLEL